MKITRSIRRIWEYIFSDYIKHRHYRLILRALKRIQNGDRFHALSVCENVYLMAPHVELSRLGVIEILSHYWKTWKHYSGNSEFPVLSTDLGSVNNPIIQFRNHQTTGTLWKGRQGELRKDLVRHLILELEHELT